MQKIFTAEDYNSALDGYFKDLGAKKILLVCDAFAENLRPYGYFADLGRLGIEVIRFSDFGPNPEYDSVVSGVKSFNENGCDAVAAIGGGSALDVAKCIKLFAKMDSGSNFLEQQAAFNNIPLFVVPTTAGTGSEATRFAVIYFNGAKQSVTHDSIIPQAVLLDAEVLKSLPEYQRKSTMLDALCHAAESFWSVNSTEESKAHSKKAIRLILDNMDGYLSNIPDANANMLLAANIAGKAINITQTTAGHAMCYKLTSLYGIAHGHAAALCVKELFPYMISNVDKCIDKRGRSYLEDTFADIALAFDCSSAQEAAARFGKLFKGLELPVPKADEKDFEILKKSVNPVRLKNNPIELDEDTIDMLYHKILD